MTEVINLKYSGKRIKENDGMEVSEVADTLEGFGDFLKTIISNPTNSEEEILLVVQGFRNGSLDIQFALEVAAAAQTTLSAINSGDLLTAIKQVLGLLKHLKGEPPKSLKQATSGGVFVENNSGQITVFNQPIVNLVLNTNVSQNAEQFVRHPLQEAAEHLEIKVNGKLAAAIDRSSSEEFLAVGSGDPLGEYRSDQHLTIQTVVLEGDGLWRFSDGRNKFRAEIEDKKFLHRVRLGAERFGRGDILRVRLRSKQEKIRGQLRTSHFIEEVLGHEPHIIRQATLI